MPIHAILRIALGPFRFGSAIPLFICTSTRVSCDFDVPRIYAVEMPESNVSSARRRRFATLTSGSHRPYPASQFAIVYADWEEKRMYGSSSVSALTELARISNEDEI
jgi:hypothetical protein